MGDIGYGEAARGDDVRRQHCWVGYSGTVEGTRARASISAAVARS
jgi:hypothetical protein